MTISNEASREPTYTGNGSTSVYSFSFPVYDESDVMVTVATNATPPVVSTLTLTTDYTVTLASSTLPSTGSITLVAGNLTTGYLLSIRRVVPLTNTTDLINEGRFSGRTHEVMIDKTVMRAQQNTDFGERALKLPEYEAGTPTNSTIPGATERANKALTFDSNGNPTASSSIPVGSVAITAFGEALVEAATASAGRDVLGATSGKFGTSHLQDAAITAALMASSAVPQVFQARMTLTANTPVTFSDVTAATTMRVSRYGGDKIALYDGTNWQYHTMSADVTVAVPNTADTMYDLFIYNNAGTLTLDPVAWTNDTTRATALATQNGIFVKNGATGRRYVGSFRTTNVSGNTEDSAAKRYVWNFYNRVGKRLYRTDATNTWAYTTDTFRQARATATNQVEVVIGVEEDPVLAQVIARASNTNTSVRVSVGIGINSTSLSSASLAAAAETQVANEAVTAMAVYRGHPGLGQSDIVWLEKSEATGVTTWEGDNGTTGNEIQSGIMGEVRC